MPEDYNDRTLPVPMEHYRAAGPSRTEYLGAEPETQALPIAHYFWILKRHRWRIVPFVAASVLATLIVSARLQPIYEARTTIDVDRQTPTGVIGQDAMILSGARIGDGARVQRENGAERRTAPVVERLPGEVFADDVLARDDAGRHRVLQL